MRVFIENEAYFAAVANELAGHYKSIPPTLIETMTEWANDDDDGNDSYDDDDSDEGKSTLVFS